MRRYEENISFSKQIENQFLALFFFTSTRSIREICRESVKRSHRSLNLHTYATPHLGSLVTRQHRCLSMHVTRGSDFVSCCVQGRNYCRGHDIQWHSNNDSGSDVGPFLCCSFPLNQRRTVVGWSGLRWNAPHVSQDSEKKKKAFPVPVYFLYLLSRDKAPRAIKLAQPKLVVRSLQPTAWNPILSLIRSQTPSPPPALYLVYSCPAATQPHEHTWVQKLHTYAFIPLRHHFLSLSPFVYRCQAPTQQPHQSWGITSSVSASHLNP